MKPLMPVTQTIAIAMSVCAALFAVFPLTDTDIWWHLACAREWVTTWTPVREPVVNVHEIFQQAVAFVFNLGGAPLLVAFKAFLWGLVFALFLWPSVRTRQDNVIANSQQNVIANSVGVKQSIKPLAFFVVILFIFRYQFEIRPVLFSLLFLGVYWNVLPWLFVGAIDRSKTKVIASVLLILSLQWIWCKSQGLYILGPIFAMIVLSTYLFEMWKLGKKMHAKVEASRIFLVVLLLLMPFLHRDGLNLFLYPFGLLDRLLGLSPSAAVFASEIAENRSPFTLLMAGENVLQSALMIVFCVIGIACSFRKVVLERSLAIGSKACSVEGYRTLWLLITAILALIAERNFVLFLPVFFAVGVKCWPRSCPCKHGRNARPTHLFYSLLPTSNRLLSTVYFLLPTLLIAFILGLWLRSMSNYDSMVAYQRVPVAAAEWMKSNPHSGRLFNDDRAGGYLAFANPSDSTYIDGRFILKTADFFEKYLRYAESPRAFLHDAELQNMDRVVLPLRYYARWDKLLATLDSAENWHVVYHDPFFVVMDRTER